MPSSIQNPVSGLAKQTDFYIRETLVAKGYHYLQNWEMVQKNIDHNFLICGIKDKRNLISIANQLSMDMKWYS